MKNEIDLKNFSIRTDLVVDIFDLDQKVTGIDFEKREQGEVKVIDITIREKENELKKKPGKYITISFTDVTDKKNKQEVMEVFNQELRGLLEYCKLEKEAKCLVVGLGNDQSTPDSLGPKVVNHILVTKYLFDIPGLEVEEGYRNVSAFIPGVTGTTGIESSDIILGIIEKTKPDFLIVVDALASSSIERINKTIQMTDTGIHPGAGVGSNRKEISKEMLHIPVICIGIPTVIEAITIVSDTINYMMRQFSYNKNNIDKQSKKLVPVTQQNYLEHEENLTEEEKKALLGMVGNLKEEEMKSLIFEVLTPIGYNMMVTPKEVDFVIDKLSEVISTGINQALHQKKEEM